MYDLVFFDPMERCGDSAPEGSSDSEALTPGKTPPKGSSSRQWRRGPQRKQNAKNLVLQDLQLLASQRGSAESRTLAVE
jgi:hypothetical protein